MRILVNREMANLDRLLAVLPAVLKPNGIAAIISFHSGEDRRVKDSFRDCLRGGIYSEVSRSPIVANENEQKLNPRCARRSCDGRKCRRDFRGRGHYDSIRQFCHSSRSDRMGKGNKVRKKEVKKPKQNKTAKK